MAAVPKTVNWGLNAGCNGHMSYKIRAEAWRLRLEFLQVDATCSENHRVYVELQLSCETSMEATKLVNQC